MKLHTWSARPRWRPFHRESITYAARYRACADRSARAGSVQVSTLGVTRYRGACWVVSDNLGGCVRRVQKKRVETGVYLDQVVNLWISCEEFLCSLKNQFIFNQ